MTAVAGVLNALSSAQMAHSFTTLQQSADQDKGHVCRQWLSSVLAQSDQILLIILLTCNKMGFDTRRKIHTYGRAVYACTQ